MHKPCVRCLRISSSSFYILLVRLFLSRLQFLSISELQHNTLPDNKAFLILATETRSHLFYLNEQGVGKEGKEQIYLFAYFVPGTMINTS